MIKYWFLSVEGTVGNINQNLTRESGVEWWWRWWMLGKNGDGLVFIYIISRNKVITTKWSIVGHFNQSWPRYSGVNCVDDWG